MKAILSLSLGLSMLTAVACGGSNSCDKLTKDVFGDDKACETWVEADLLEGSKNKETCDFLTGDADYKSWVASAKDSYEKDKAKAKK